MSRRIKPVTTAELSALADTSFGTYQDLNDLAERLSKVPAETPISRPTETALTFLNLAHAAQELARQVLLRAAMDEQSREIERLVKERAKCQS